MARRKFSRTGGRTPGYQVSADHFQTALRIPAPDWAEKIPCIILPNQEPVFAKPFGNGPVRLGTQGFFRPFLKTFVAPFRPPPTDCPWVSEDANTSEVEESFNCLFLLSIRYYYFAFIISFLQLLHYLNLGSKPMSLQERLLDPWKTRLY